MDKGRDGNKNSKLYIQIVSCYHNGREKFCGIMDENWIHILSQYNNHADLVELNRRQKLQYISDIFKEDAPSIYDSKVGNLGTWGKAVSVLTDRYNGFARKRALVDETRPINLST